MQSALAFVRRVNQTCSVRRIRFSVAAGILPAVEPGRPARRRKCSRAFIGLESFKTALRCHRFFRAAGRAPAKARIAEDRLIQSHDIPKKRRMILLLPGGEGRDEGERFKPFLPQFIRIATTQSGPNSPPCRPDRSRKQFRPRNRSASQEQSNPPGWRAALSYTTPECCRRGCRTRRR